MTTERDKPARNPIAMEITLINEEDNFVEVAVFGHQGTTRLSLTQIVGAGINLRRDKFFGGDARPFAVTADQAEPANFRPFPYRPNDYGVV